jgi:hypothetical protein
VPNGGVRKAFTLGIVKMEMCGGQKSYSSEPLIGHLSDHVQSVNSCLVRKQRYVRPRPPAGMVEEGVNDGDIIGSC